MADVVNILADPIVYLTSVPSRKHPATEWLKNPDLSLLLNIVPQRYWKVVGGVGGTVEERTQPEKDAVDAALLVILIAGIKETIKSRLSLGSSIQGFFDPVSVAGLVLTINVGALIVDDETTIVADGALTKFVNPTIIYNTTSDDFSIEVFERTDGLYADLADDEVLAFDFGEWSVVASGTVLVPV
jgi:hypothetical protein